MIEHGERLLLGLAVVIVLCHFPEPMLATAKQALEAIVIIKLVMELLKRK